jgi:signal transduction histidine kinase
VARAVVIAAIVFAVGSLALSAVVSITRDDRIEPGTIVVVGDPDIPGMREVVGELRARVEDGDELKTSMMLDGGAFVIAGIVLLWIGVGSVIVWRQPGNWAGWVFLITGSAFPVSLISSTVVIANVKAGDAFPLTGLFAWTGEFALYPVALIPLLFLLYPDGHPPSPRWRWAVAGLLGGTFLAFVGFVLSPGPYNAWVDDGIVYANALGIDGFEQAGALITLGTITAFGAAVSTAVAVVMRFRRSSGEERQQMRVLAFVASVAGIALVSTIMFGFVAEAFGIGDGDTTPIFDILWLLAALSFAVGIPVAYLVAIFRYRLWELGVVIKKAAVAVVLTLIIGTVGLVVLALSTQVAWVLPDPLPFFWLIGIGVMALPFLRIARRIARRIVFGKRATQQEVLAAFGERVGESYSVADVLPRMVQILASGTGATSARVLLRVGDELHEEAAVGDPVGEEYLVTVAYEGEELGALAATFPSNDPIDATKARLMENLAGQASLALRNVKLIEELRASRQRLVAAQDEERRKIERNIHDGAQQQLVALTVKLRLAQDLVATDPPKAEAILSDLQGETQTALDDLRDLARGIYPPLLADRGLAEALGAQARKAAVPTTVEAEDVGRYPAEVESAVYFCALEALNNVAKYADATAVEIRLARSDGHLTFLVRDDGAGFDVDSRVHGTGLQGMADRIEAVGGRLEIVSALGEGATVTGSIPVEVSS